MMWSLILITIASAALYRLGGYGEPFNTKYRDFGVPAVCLAWLWFYLSAPWWVYFLTFGAMFGSMTTYWDYWGTDDVEWYEWALTGFMYAFSFIFLAYATGHWLGFLYRCLILSIITAMWSEFIGDDITEEIGRGAFIALTLPLMLIGG